MRNLMPEWDEIVYKQSSQDWRHRDVLTWQYPAVLVLVGGILVARAFGLQGELSWLRTVLLGIALGLAICLSAALTQNMSLQDKNRDICEKIYEKHSAPNRTYYQHTARFTFNRIGSGFLLIFSWAMCVVLLLLFLYGLSGAIVTENMRKVIFETDKSRLTEAARTILKENAAWLWEHPNVKVRIEGYCDERRSVEYNLALGEERAKRVRNYLISLGIDPTRLFTISYGKERPMMLGHNEGAWAQNRRVEFNFVQ